MTLGRRVAVLRDGRVQQVDTPQALYARPANLFVAAFIGSPAMNLVEADLSGDGLSFAGFSLPVSRHSIPDDANGRVVVGIRPEALEDAAFAGPPPPRGGVDGGGGGEVGAGTHVIFSV